MLSLSRENDRNLLASGVTLTHQALRAWSPLSRTATHGRRGAWSRMHRSPSPAPRERVPSTARRVRVLPRSQFSPDVVPHPHTVVDDIERLIQVDVGRHVTALFEAARGGLRSAASALAAAPVARVGLITGFFVPLGSPPAAETDGPVGAALLARGLAEIGIPCRLATDEPCRNACAVALGAAGVPEAPVDAVAVDAPLAPLIETWAAAGITHAVSIERCGRSPDGGPRNMRGEDISAHTAPLDDLFTAGPWDTIAIGDGGNEIGMGALPHGLIAR